MPDFHAFNFASGQARASFSFAQFIWLISSTFSLFLSFYPFAVISARRTENLTGVTIQKTDLNPSFGCKQFIASLLAPTGIQQIPWEHFKDIIEAIRLICLFFKALFVSQIVITF